MQKEIHILPYGSIELNSNDQLIIDLDKILELVKINSIDSKKYNLVIEFYKDYYAGLTLEGLFLRNKP